MLLSSNATAAAAQESIASVALTVHHSFIKNGEIVPPGREITYQMRPLEANNSMPAETISGLYIFSITETTRAKISPITFDRAGVFHYEITVTSEGIIGLRTDSRVYTIEIIVAYNGHLAYNVFVNGEKTDRILFEHIIDTVNIDGSKTWNHGVLPARYHPEYITVLVKNGDNVVTRERITKNEHWSWSFVLPKYDDDREIVYTISEEKVAGYTMRADGHNLINTFNQNDPNIPPDWDIPQTGDDLSMTLWIILLTISGSLLITVIPVCRKLQTITRKKLIR